MAGNNGTTLSVGDVYAKYSQLEAVLRGKHSGVIRQLDTTRFATFAFPLGGSLKSVVWMVFAADIGIKGHYTHLVVSVIGYNARYYEYSRWNSMTIQWLKKDFPDFVDMLSPWERKSFLALVKDAMQFLYIKRAVLRSVGLDTSSTTRNILPIRTVLVGRGLAGVKNARKKYWSWQSQFIEFAPEILDKLGIQFDGRFYPNETSKKQRKSD